jgi:hypothetical protein
MIRPIAARKLAEELFGTYLAHGFCTREMIDVAADIIERSVRIDEKAAELECMAERIRVMEK